LTGWQYGFLYWLLTKKSLDLPSLHLLAVVTNFLSVCSLYASPTTYSTKISVIRTFVEINCFGGFFKRKGVRKIKY
jgi:hypothetical protein